jgi:hypothetical protein
MVISTKTPLLDEFYFKFRFPLTKSQSVEPPRSLAPGKYRSAGFSIPFSAGHFFYLERSPP